MGRHVSFLKMGEKKSEYWQITTTMTTTWHATWHEATACQQKDYPNGPNWDEPWKVNIVWVYLITVSSSHNCHQVSERRLSTETTDRFPGSVHAHSVSLEKYGKTAHSLGTPPWESSQSSAKSRDAYLKSLSAKSRDTYLKSLSAKASKALLKSLSSKSSHAYLKSLSAMSNNGHLKSVCNSEATDT